MTARRPATPAPSSASKSARASRRWARTASAGTANDETDEPPRAQRGLTLLELAVVLAVLAVLGALALPSMAARLRGERLQTAAEMLAADIADARHEAARRGQALHIEGRAADSGGPAWCWSVATAPGCPCGNDGAAP
ncbi:MAG: prepilin-type N-terminal cleavage/methylation domain-containing protein [Rubrivivax sp.]